METEQYGQMIFLSAEAKEKVSKMNDKEISLLAMKIANDLRNSYNELSKVDGPNTAKILGQHVGALGAKEKA